MTIICKHNPEKGILDYKFLNVRYQDKEFSPKIGITN